MISRRHFLAGSAALALPVGARADPLDLPIGLQLYTVTDALRKDFDGTLKAVAAIGYKAVETGLMLGGRDTLQLKQIFAGLGLAWESAHCGADELRSGLDTTIRAAHLAELKYIVCAFPPIPGSFKQAIAGLSLDDWKANADLFNTIGEATKKAGIRFCYHNHNVEFRRYGGSTGYDTLLARTDPELVAFELDCGWMVSAGFDPVQYLGRYPDRYVMLHLKDLRADHIPNRELKMTSTELGSGIIDWKKLLSTARKTAVKGLYVEQEPPFARSSLRSVKISYDYLRMLNV